MQFGKPDKFLVADGGVVVFERVVQVPNNKDIPNFTLSVTSLPFGLCSMLTS